MQAWRQWAALHACQQHSSISAVSQQAPAHTPPPNPALPRLEARRRVLWKLQRAAAAADHAVDDGKVRQALEGVLPAVHLQYNRQASAPRSSTAVASGSWHPEQGRMAPLPADELAGWLADRLAHRPQKDAERIDISRGRQVPLPQQLRRLAGDLQQGAGARTCARYFGVALQQQPWPEMNTGQADGRPLVVGLLGCLCQRVMPVQATGRRKQLQCQHSFKARQMQPPQRQRHAPPCPLSPSACRWRRPRRCGSAQSPTPRR